MQPYRIAVFASGSGSNFQAIVDQVQKGKLDVSIELLVCDRPNAFVVERAKEAKVPVFAFRPKEYASREAYESLILQELQERQVDLIVMAGYMRIITNVLVVPYYGRMINIHPSLLPSFPGVRAIEQAVEYGVKQTGVTVHFVDGGLDSGPIIAQRSVEIHEHETADSLAERIHAAEHVLLPQVIRWLREGRVSIDGRRVSLRL
ncbi:phosphoribosylglycinamide formyltransferase [Paenibacillus sedimenti]|uniref:Phosphoribosylglycinamide formyltransferase n=1 Tax=Paenibacillus sedimenti TaxID=2770274 RepID=A0A926KSJ7_9BACL|nr:phosphoribosylglycinamide formyltransferase [Paenibacillus sedimenti]MBD0383327.1 phosphoribosylglycinamide formyltransferase [Paenibacillus sedimenti]